MKFLIIGSEGFIGKNLVSFISSLKFEVHKADIVSIHGETNYYTISNFPRDIFSLFENLNPDVCINASGAASVPNSISEPFKDYHANTYNLALILEAVRLNCRDCKIINLSSAAVYGNPKELPIKEEHATNPISPYGMHKLGAEMLCSEYATHHGLSTCSLRIFSAYGPGLRKQLFWDLYQKSKSANEIELYGTGNESRDFIFVDDISSACLKIVSNAKFKGEAINVANGQEIRISTAVKCFFDSLGSSFVSWKFMGQSRVGDPINWKADIDLLKSLGYNEKFDFQTGIKKYVEWIENELA